MIYISLAICCAYAILILFSLFVDPKGKKSHRWNKHSILQLLLFSTLKMLLAIGVVVITAACSRIDPSGMVGLSGLSFSWQDIAFGLIAAFGFFGIYLIWQIIKSCACKRAQSSESGSDLIGLLPKKWLPLIGVFMIISLEAGLLEEIFFRGIVQSHIAALYTTSSAVVLSGILFGVAHFYQGVSGILGTSALGIWLGMTYAVTGNLLVPVVGHYLGDFACMMLGAGKLMQYRRKQQ
jgi:membrane protease YdiL (CAAX protease family)